MPTKDPTSSRKPKETTRRNFIGSSLGFGVTAAAGSLAAPALANARGAEPASPAQEVRAFELDELPIAELQEGMKSGKFTARSLVEGYLQRIEEIDSLGPALNAVIELNPDALSIADSR